MESNSKIFTNTVFGTSSGMTAAEIAEKNTSTQETYLKSSTASSMNTTLPRVPSNQRKVKDY